MIGLFCGTKAGSNEEYKQVIKYKMNVFIIIGIIGAITLAVTILADRYWQIAISEHSLSMYMGFGIGLLAAAIILWVKNRMLLKNQAKLKENWIAHSDERNQQISSSAFRIATAFMLIVIYGIALVGGLWYPILIKVLMIIIALFIAAYVVAYAIISKRI